MAVLITGGAGFIGSHTCVELLNAGDEVTVFDNYCNIKLEALRSVERITGKSVERITGDICDREAVEAAPRSSGASAVIHFAGLWSVGDSSRVPLEHCDNNVVGTVRLLEALGACGVKTLVFRASATVYGEPQFLP